MDIANLGVRIDSSGVEKGVQSLDKLAASAENAEAATKKLQDQASSANKSLSDVGASASSATDGLTAMQAASAALAESEDAATKRIKDMVRASLDQQMAMQAALRVPDRSKYRLALA